MSCFICYYFLEVILYVKSKIFEEKSLNKLVLKFGIPSIIALMMEMITGITDTAFAGHIAGDGQNTLSAMAILAPLLSIFIAFQTLFSMSSGIMMSKNINNFKAQQNYMLLGILMSVTTSFIISIVIFFKIDNILDMMGASGTVLILAKEYLKIQLISNVISSAGYTLSNCIRAIGYPRVEMVIIIVAVFSNIIFNILFTFELELGISGLALGTLISEILGLSFAVMFIIKKRRFKSVQKTNFKESAAMVLEMFKIGFAQTIIQILSGCTGFFINSRILVLGDMTALAAWNIAQKIYIFLLMPIVGLTQGMQTIIAYFEGVRDKKKVNEVSKTTKMQCILYGAIVYIAVFFYGRNLVEIFGGTQEVFNLSNSILLMICITFPLVGNFYANVVILQITGKENKSVALVVARQILLLIPIMYLMSALFLKIGYSPLIGLFLAGPIADVMVLVISNKKINKIEKRSYEYFRKENSK